MCQSGYENYDPNKNVSDRLSDNEIYALNLRSKREPNKSLSQIKKEYEEELTWDLEDY